MEVLHIHYSVQEAECRRAPRDWWVIAQREPTSDCAEVTEARCTLFPAPSSSLLSSDTRQEPGMQHSMCVCVTGLTADGCEDREKDAGGGGQPWAAGTGFSPVLRPSRDWWGRQREECGGRKEGEVVWPADNTWPEPDRADMRACPHLCSGKATPGAGGRQTQIEFQQCT